MKVSLKISDDAREAIATAEKLGTAEPEPLNRLFQKLGKLAGTYPIPHLAVEICCES